MTKCSFCHNSSFNKNGSLVSSRARFLFLILESSICILVCILVKKDYKEVLSFFYIFSANILPHCVMDKKMAVMMILKSVYNLLFISILCHYFSLFYPYGDDEAFENVNMFNISLERLSSTKRRQAEYSLDTTLSLER